MQPTAGRRTTSLYFMKTLPLRATLTLMRSFPNRLPFGLDVYVAVPHLAPFASGG